MRKRRFGATEFGLGLLSGALLGLALGFIMAPRSGAETRFLIADRATGIRSTASELLDQAKHSIDVAASQIEKVAGLQERVLRKKLNEIRAQLEAYQLNEA